MFKPLGLRIFDGCKMYIRKCLCAGRMYYFCNDYIIAEDGKTIRRISKNLRPVSDDFFCMKPQVNISAIVGMNGDGKSSIIELMIRLINNCAITYELFYKPENLRRVEHVKAEFFYMIDNIVYRIAEEEEDVETKLWRIADLNDQTKNEWTLEENKLVEAKGEIDKFFFTFVSNYSHYAYNIYDFHQEWDMHSKKKNDNEKCWLDHIFHKNDEYLVPITLHPYRNNGNIDINKEKTLSKQRLLSLFLNADDPAQNPQSFRNVNGKEATTLILKETKESKLQTKTIIEYFDMVHSKQIFKVVLKQISNVDNNDKVNEIEYERLIDTVLPYFWEDSIDEVLKQDEGFEAFANCVIKWIDSKYKKTLSNNSDILQVIKGLNRLSTKFTCITIPKSSKTHYFRIARLNGTQLGRLDTIYRILRFYNVNPDIVTKDSHEMTLEEKCWNFIVYKTWTILTTYPEFTEKLDAGRKHGSVREYGVELEECLKTIKDDQNSLATRELRQAFNFLNEEIDKGGLYERLGRKTTDDVILVDIDILKKHYHGSKISPDQLPPPIYEWDIEFQQVNNKSEKIEFDSFSSGEKQMLNSLGAIIYNLQDIEYAVTTKYSNINIILEEIELYYHPEYQRLYIKRLLDLIEGLHLKNIHNVSIMFVTHSPFILSDIPKNNVLFLKKGIPCNTMQENTFGANIHSLLKNGFFMPNLPMGELAFQKINEMFRKLNTGDIDITEMDSLYQHILLVGEPFLRNQLLGLYNALRKN